VKVLVSWLRELVDVPVDTATLARDLHMTGFEVASVEYVGTQLGTVPISNAVGTVPNLEGTRTAARGTANDAVIDFEITANRPDCLSMIGLAREVATKYKTTVREPPAIALGPVDSTTTGPLKVTIEDATRCPRYTAALLDVTVGPSPAWLVERLSAAGIRSISNIVDVTNYVLLELGHPLHAFDLAKLDGPALRIRTARAGESLTTLDGQKRTLTTDMLVIADATRPQALGGVMGGADSEVSASTKTVVLESAYFQPGGIRRTSKKLGLSTEASYRFERGADVAVPAVALARACALIEQVGAGKVRSGYVDAYPQPRLPAIVELDVTRVARVLGAQVEATEIRRILGGLGFAVSETDATNWMVSVPSWRVDVAREMDLIEEIARHYGYDRLPTTFPALTTVPARPSPLLEERRVLHRLVTAAGFNECVTFSFVAERAAREFASADELVSIANPLSETFAVLRPSLLSGLLDSLSHNRRHGQRDVRLFELGTRFLKSRGEVQTLALGWLGAGQVEHWTGGARNVDFFDMKGVVEELSAALGLSVTTRPVDRPFLARGRAAELVAFENGSASRPFAVLGQLTPALATSRDIPAQDEVYVAEIDLAAVADLLTLLEVPRSESLPRFPAIVRDLSILVADTLPAADVRGTIRSVAPPTLVRVGEFDRYEGKGIPEGRVSLSYRLTFQAPDRTLTDVEADAATNAIVAELARVHGAVRR
jgi:phenylalanyl-tRNA synthetase beta chain